MAEWKRQGKRVVFTNGCFDLLHLGHVDYIEKARSLGDVLVVGLNTDDSIGRFKGPQRPIQDQNSRARVMASSRPSIWSFSLMKIPLEPDFASAAAGFGQRE